MASQSLFATNSAIFDNDGAPVTINNDGPTNGGRIGGIGSSNELYRIGFSCLGVMIAMSAGGNLLKVGWLDDLRRMAHSMPLVATCSVAISASFHPMHPFTEETVGQPLRWGVVPTENSVSYCSFTDDVDLVVCPEDGDLVVSEELAFCPKN